MSGSPPAVGGSGGGALQMQVMTASTTFTIPAARVKFTLVGGGGSSATGDGGWNTSVGGGAGSGATAIWYASGLTVGNTITVSVGAGGATRTGTTVDGYDGGASTLTSGTQTIATVTAGGGQRGWAGNSPGNGGTAIGGTVNIAGMEGNPAYGGISRTWAGSASTLGKYGGGGQGAYLTTNNVGQPGIVIAEWVA